MGRSGLGRRPPLSGRGSRLEPEITRLLQAIRKGQDGAWERLVGLVYDELKRIAKYRLRARSPGGQLSTTELVHETYLQLLGRLEASWENRRHFFGAVAQCMKEILVDEARRRGRRKRGGDWQRVFLESGLLSASGNELELLALDAALEKLKLDDPVQYEIVLLRYFAGLSIDEVAQALEVSPSSVDRNWRFARAWLQREIGS